MELPDDGVVRFMLATLGSQDQRCELHRASSFADQAALRSRRHVSIRPALTV